MFCNVLNRDDRVRILYRERNRYRDGAIGRSQGPPTVPKRMSFGRVTGYEKWSEMGDQIYIHSKGVFRKRLEG